MKQPSRAVYILLSLTWGLPLTFAGALTFAVLIAAGKHVKRFGHCMYIEVGENWGGLEFGLFFLTHKNPSYHLCAHEHGHGLQNIVWGPLMPFVITIPSAIRWHWRRHRIKMGHGAALVPYDAIWFEHQASLLGQAFIQSRETL